MRWLRWHRKWGGCLALFALALQLSLSFAHVHPKELYGGPLALTSNAATGGSSGPSVAAVHPNAGHQHGAAILCDVCFTVNLLGAAQIADAPRLPLPVAAASRAVARADQTAPPRQHALFQARAPPSA